MKVLRAALYAAITTVVSVGALIFVHGAPASDILIKESLEMFLVALLVLYFVMP